MKGVLKTWKEDRGFGFITPDNGGRDIFIHITAIGEASRRPIPGDIVHYQIVRDKRGKFRAINAYIDGITDKKRQNFKPKSKGVWLKYSLLTALILMLIAAAVVWYVHQNGMI